MASEAPLFTTIFQSTLSVRRATTLPDHGGRQRVISIHALREESDYVTGVVNAIMHGISIHALREESDLVR